MSKPRASCCISRLTLLDKKSIPEDYPGATITLSALKSDSYALRSGDLRLRRERAARARKIIMEVVASSPECQQTK